MQLLSGTLDKATVWTSNGQKFIGGAGNQYALKDALGEGAYGAVYRCVRSCDDAVFAVKIIDPMRIGFGSGADGIAAIEQMAMREIRALQKVSSHPNIISLEGTFCSEDTRQIFIITEFAPGGDLFSHMVQRAKPLQEFEASHIAAQLSDALAFCHSVGVAHRDLKPENVLVAGIHIKLRELKSATTTANRWHADELFAVKICDLGFAKCVQGYTTKTPLGVGGGTMAYAAPECVKQAQSGSGEDYDAFKADSFSLGVVLFVMLTQSFPVKDGKEGSHRLHKHWPCLSDGAKSLLDGLLTSDPLYRLSARDASDHEWIASSRDTGKDVQDGSWTAIRGLSKSKPGSPGLQRELQHPALPGLLALHRSLVSMQRERALAMCVLAGAPTLAAISVSCWDQFHLNFELTDKRLGEARRLFEHQYIQTSHSISLLHSDLKSARSLVLDLKAAEKPRGREKHLATFDKIFTAYNRNCFKLIQIAGEALDSVGSVTSSACARHYRLLAAAAEQLGRERAFVCGHSQQDWGASVEEDSTRSPSSPKTRPSSPSSPSRGPSCRYVAKLPPEKLQRLSEILGARKILIGTARGDSPSTSGDVVTSSTGLIGMLFGEDAAPVLSTADIAELESVEERAMKSSRGDVLLIDEWYQTLTRLLKEIHSRIAVTLIEGLQLPAPEVEALESRSSGCSETPATERGACCAVGLLALLFRQRKAA